MVSGVIVQKEANHTACRAFRASPGSKRWRDCWRNLEKPWQSSGPIGQAFSWRPNKCLSPVWMIASNFWANSSVGKESACNAGDPGSIPGSRRSTGEGIGYPLQYSWASLVAQLVMNLPAMWETWVQPLGWEDPLEKGKASTPVFWPGKFHGLYSPWGCKESDTTEWHSLSLSVLADALKSGRLVPFTYDPCIWFYSLFLCICR